MIRPVHRHLSRPRSRQRNLLGATALVLVLVGCGSDTADPEAAPSDPASSVTTAAGPPEPVSGVDPAAALAKAYAGILGELPTTPTEPVADQSIWVVSCGQQVSTCSTPSAAAVEAAEAIGWTAKVCDGQLNPNG